MPFSMSSPTGLRTCAPYSVEPWRQRVPGELQLEGEDVGDLVADRPAGALGRQRPLVRAQGAGEPRRNEARAAAYASTRDCRERAMRARLGRVRVHVIQLSYGDDESTAERTARVAGLVRSQAGADLVVLPELWPNGGFAYDSWEDGAEPLDGPTTAALSAAARELGATVHIGVVRRAGRRRAAVQHLGAARS